MFKKRVLKKNNLKRVRVDDDDIGNGGNDENHIETKPVDQTNKPSGTEPEKAKEDENDNDNKFDKKSKSQVANDDKTQFKPDTAIEEQLRQLKKNEKLISNSKLIQKRDSDGDKIYTGLISHKSRNDDLVKPLSSHVKQNYIMDYQQDVCKDFLKNGYCGFGDTCKFLHYREEFKKNDDNEKKDWEIAAKRRKKF